MEDDGDFGIIAPFDSSKLPDKGFSLPSTLVLSKKSSDRVGCNFIDQLGCVRCHAKQLLCQSDGRVPLRMACVNSRTRRWRKNFLAGAQGCVAADCRNCPPPQLYSRDQIAAGQLTQGWTRFRGPKIKSLKGGAVLSSHGSPLSRHRHKSRATESGCMDKWAFANKR